MVKAALQQMPQSLAWQALALRENGKQIAAFASGLVSSLCSSGKWQGADSQRYSGVRRARTAKCKPEPSGGARAAGRGALGALP